MNLICSAFLCDGNTKETVFAWLSNILSLLPSEHCCKPYCCYHSHHRPQIVPLLHDACHHGDKRPNRPPSVENSQHGGLCFMRLLVPRTFREAFSGQRTGEPTPLLSSGFCPFLAPPTLLHTNTNGSRDKL